MEGYWYPVTCTLSSASIDWCEANYQVSFYIAEFWNCLSSFLISVAGIYGLYVIHRCRGAGMEYVMAILFILVGLGSAAFHGTLKFEYQLWDEIPMLWTGSTCVVCSAMYMYCQLSPSFQFYQKPLFFLLLLYNYIWFVLHSANQYVVPFQVNFIILMFSVFFAMVNCIQLYYQLTIGDNFSGLFLKMYAGTILTAFGLWLMDVHLCEYMSHLPINPQFHSWWHLLCSVSSHSSLMFEILLKSRQRKVSVRVVGKTLPTLDIGYPD